MADHSTPRDHLISVQEKLKRLQQVIDRQYSFLIDCLSIKDILPLLLSHDIITHKQKMSIKALIASGDATECFLDEFRPKVDEKRFANFIKVLKLSSHNCPNHKVLATTLIEASGVMVHDDMPLDPPQVQKNESNTIGPEDLPENFDEENFEGEQVLESIHAADSYDYPTKGVYDSEEADYSSESEGSTSDYELAEEPTVQSLQDMGQPLSDVWEESRILEESEPWQSVTRKSRVHQSKSEFHASKEPTSHKSTPSTQRLQTVNSLPGNSELSIISKTVSQSKSNNLALVCVECYGAHTQSVKVGICKLQTHTKIRQVKAEKGYVSVRERKNFNKEELCHHWHACSFQGSCRYAHSTFELDYWKDTIQPQYESCIDCNWKKVTKCADRSHSMSKKLVLFKDKANVKLVHIRFPLNCPAMKDKKYTFHHTYTDCRKPGKDRCPFPHDKVEQVFWNAWKDKYCPDNSLEFVEPPTVHFLDQLKQLDVTFESLNRRHKFQAHELNVKMQLLEEELTFENYRDKMATLITCEESVHELALKRHDGSYRLLFYDGFGLYRHTHDWYACIVMTQVIADMLRQAATHVEITHNGQCFQAQLLMLQRFTRDKKEPLLVVGFEDDLNPSLLVLHNKLKRVSEIEIQAHFILKYSYFHSLRKAVKYLQNPIVDKFVPTMEHFLRKKPVCEPCLVLQDTSDFPEQFQLDRMYQIPACQKLLSCPPTLPFIITGPFGTGKTRVIAALAFHILKVQKSSRILIATHHRRTADEYTSKYFTKEILEESLSGILAVRLVGRYGKPSFGAKGHITKSSWTFQSGELQQYQLIITTFILSMSLKNPGQFTHIFIDEGAQAREPECVAAFRFALPQTKILIVGDHLQVGPRTSVLGEKARKYGLSVSLLERLHSLYNRGDMIEKSKPYRAVLLSNYRCHSAILHLSSTLFYDSTVQANALDDPHPDWKFPLQFVCTSLQKYPQCTWAPDKELEAAATKEITAIKVLVQQCADNWPTDKWGEKDLSSVCVVTPTRLAERLWKRAVRDTELSGVTYTVAYDIQGLEYRAVFLCTSEPVNENCTPFDPVKSLCDPRVFNTIITRSQSLVIAVGNPFRLMKIEEMIPDSEGNKHCWLSYFQRCWESNTLILSYELNQEYNSQHGHNACLSELKNYLLQGKVNQINDIPRLLHSTNIPSSTIEREYLELCNTGRTPEVFPGWKFGQDSRRRIVCQNPGGMKVTTCHLKAVSPDCCIAYPINDSHPPLTIHGAVNRRCAFSGATIEVINRKGAQSVTVAVTNQGEVNPLLCTVNPDNPAMLVPVDKVTIPMFHLKDKDKDAHINCEALREDGRHCFISCFNPQSLQGSPRVTHSIPLDVAVNLLFVVLPFFWHVKDRFPCGAALAAIPKGTSLPLAKFILQDYCSKNPQGHVYLKLKDAVVAKDLNMRRDTEAIAIIQPDDLSSCAFSVAHCPGYFSIKVHITNVADLITFAEVSENKSYKIDEEVMRKLSFTGRQSQNVITVEYEIKESDLSFHNRRRLNQPNIKIKHRGFSTSIATYKHLLSLSDLEDMLVSLPHLEDVSKAHPTIRHIPSQKAGNLNMLDKIAILCITAKVLHRKRVGHDGYNLLEMSSVKYPEAQQLVNEFLIQANYEAASRIKESFPIKMLFKRSIPLPGSEDQIGSIVASSRVIPSYPLLRLTKPSDVKTDCLLEICDLPILPSILQELITVLKIPDKTGLKQTLCLLHHHPQCAVQLSRLRQFLLAEEFHVFNKTEVNCTESLQHFIHCLPLYTSFTSPFQCIGDLFVQEGLLAAIRGTEWKRTTEELKYIANQCSNAEELSLIKSDEMFKLALTAQQSSVCVQAFIRQSKRGTLEWCFLPPNQPYTTVFWVVTATLLEKLVKYPYRVRIVSAKGTSLLSSCIQVVSDYSSGEHSNIAFVSETGGSKASSCIYLRENSEPSLFRLPQQMVINLTECINDLTKGADMARELEELYNHQVKRHERNPLSTNTVFAAIQVPFPVQPYQVSRLWLGCDPTSYVLSVRPQCMELAPDVRVCLQHMQHPLTCFTQCPTEVASKLTYSSVFQYVKLWKDAMLGASAMLGVSSTTSSLVYKDVLLKFLKFVIPPHILTQDMYMPVGEITASFRRECLTSSSDLFTIQKGDLVCARYEVDLSGTQLSDVLDKYQDCIHLSNGTVARAVLHMVVREVYDNEPIEMNFEVTGTQPSVSPLMKEILEKNKFTCELEVVSMPYSLRKPYWLLCKQDLVFRENSLDSNIATGNIICSPEFVGEFDHEWVEQADVKVLVKKHHRLEMILQKLSTEHRSVLEEATRNSLQLIQTPPGTNGRMLASILAYTLALRNKVLFEGEKCTQPRACVFLCVPSEFIYEMTKSLCKLPGVCSSDGDGIRVLQITSRKVERQYYHIPYDDDRVIFDGKSPGICTTEDHLQPFILHHIVHMTSPYGDELRKCENYFNTCCRDKKIPSLKAQLYYADIMFKAESEILCKNSSDIIICTCSEASSERIRRYFQPVQVVVYNASMITEPETFSAIHQALHVVLVGDHQQHCPLLSSDVSLQNGMNVSLFERMYRLIEREYSGDVEKCPLFVRLKEQEIMLPSICKLSSSIFYDNQLLTSKNLTSSADPGLANFWPNAQKVVICNTVGCVKEAVDSNREQIDNTEAMKTVEVVRALKCRLEKKDSTIAVLTYSRAQKVHIELNLASKRDPKHMLVGSVKVLTLDECIRQDTGYDLVILSTASSELNLPMAESVNSEYKERQKRESVGHLLDPRKLCVALTRSRQGVIILGNVEVLKYCDGVWQKLVTLCEHENCIVSADTFPPPQGQREPVPLPAESSLRTGMSTSLSSGTQGSHDTKKKSKKRRK